MVVIASAAHDTASAGRRFPRSRDRCLLHLKRDVVALGSELGEPLTTVEAMESGFTNEVAANSQIRYLKNIMGMWIQQECPPLGKPGGEADLEGTG